MDAALGTPARGAGGQAWRRFVHHRAALAAGFFLILLVLVAILADVLAPEPIDAFNISQAFAPPGTSGYLFGADDIGRDVLSRVIHGARISVSVGVTAVAIAATGGTILGLAAGYRGGRTDMLISRLLDVMLAFPSLLLAITIVASLGPGLQNAVIALGIAGIPAYARVVRGSTLAARELGYVRAAVMVGMSDGRVMVRHVLPNVVSPVIVMATLGLGTRLSQWPD